MHTESATTYLGRQFASYGQGGPAADHADAMACRDLEERLAYGLHLFQLVQDRADADARRAASAGTAEHDIPAARYLYDLLNLWLVPAQPAIALIAAWEARGYAVDHADAFRRAVVRARHSTHITPEQAAAVCDRIARHGFSPDGKTTEELRRELSSRLGA